MAFPASARRRWLVTILGLGILISLGAALVHAQSKDKPKPKDDEDPPRKLTKAPELEGGIAWLNTGKPLTLKDLKGKVVLLDFWTLCCINCIHIMPDLAKLEKKYANELVVIGVHSAKFDNEKNSESIRKAILRYDLKHPVVNDADQRIWTAYDCSSWPTLFLIDPEGNLLGQTSGEGKFELLDKVIAKVIDEHKKKKTLDEKPLRFDTAKFRDKVDSPLYFPGKVLADEKTKRIFIADSTNHRVVITDLNGKAEAVAGVGTPGRKDGPFASAQFDDPQGMAVNGDTLYVADRKNHCIRELDLKTKTVKTIAGTGEQDRERGEGGPALERGLNSPWDLLLDGDRLFIAMAGHHQIWTLNLKDKHLDPYAGTGRENIKDGPLEIANFAQPSGLTTDGKFLYVADPEVSAVRKVPMDGMGRVTTLVGTGLFDFGDDDGIGKEAKLQHAIGVQYHDGKVYVADTYNSKLKVIDLKDNAITTFIGPKKDDKERPFNEPAGLSLANGKLYVADTNAHRIRVVDLKTKAISTLPITGVQPVVLADEKK
ncbi:MAG TPA: thioredoxin-like domain-containing protein [Gemmataceae bacterium]|jgi:thiol-disulfide isomerase/thioredoxin|nr:thioredoxin-like domain-containing protein [Gemmataceae bacterium]